MQNNDSKIINTKYIKYIIFAGIIYSVLRVVPTNQLSNFEIGTLMMVILFAIFSLESLTGVNSHTENFKETMADTNSDMFDLDMDVNLDFNKSSGNKEGHETTCKKTNNDTPGLPSGVSLGFKTASIPASQPQAITDVAKPVKELAASSAHFFEYAVTISLEAFIGKASANVLCKVIEFFDNLTSHNFS